MIFQRMKVLWLGFWSSIVGHAESSNQGLVNEGMIQRQHRQLTRLREAITQLIFQKKRLQRSCADLETQLEDVQCDLKEVVMDNNDELAIRLIGEEEHLAQELEFLKGQLSQVEADLIEARNTEKQFVEQMERTKHQLQTLTSRQRALRLRREVRSQVEMASQRLENGEPSLRLIEDQIIKLEAECETIEKSTPDWKRDLQKVRAKRKRSSHQAKLQQLKMEINGRLLTGSPPRQFVPAQ